MIDGTCSVFDFDFFLVEGHFCDVTATVVVVVVPGGLAAAAE